MGCCWKSYKSNSKNSYTFNVVETDNKNVGKIENRDKFLVSQKPNNENKIAVENKKEISFINASPSNSENNCKSLNDEFNKYKNLKNVISTEGFKLMVNDLGIGVDSKDLFLFFFCFRSECKVVGEINYEEFTRGVKSFKVDSFLKLKDLRDKISSNIIFNFGCDEFSRFYNYLFTTNETKKKINIDVVKLYYEILFFNKYPICKSLIEFLEEEKINSLRKDEWTNILSFLQTLGESFPEGFELDYSWISLLDKFYYYHCKKIGKPIQAPDVKIV